MTQILTLSKAKQKPSLDFESLRQEGLDYLRQAVKALWPGTEGAPPLWTDHNTHDPGITLLELLCYGLTDVAHRMTFDAADLFAPAPAPNPAAVPFVTARYGLTTEPVTQSDYRRLLLDAFPNELRNAWLEPAHSVLHADTRKKELTHEGPGEHRVAFALRGLHRIRVLFHQNVPQARRDEILSTLIPRLYHQHRNLGEDLVLPVQATPVDPIVVCAEIGLVAGADIDETMARIVRALQDFLNPAVPRHELAELVRRGYPVERIFEGPPLRHGFILEADLQATTRFGKVRASDLIRVVLKVEGVQAVARMGLLRAGQPSTVEGWELPIAEGHEPELSLENARILFTKGRIPFKPNGKRVQEEFDRLLANAPRAGEAPLDEDFPVPSGTARALGDFTTLQESLPAVYGCGSRGLNRDRSPEALGRAKQLQAFLLVFDQLLCNALAQLTHLPELLSSKQIAAQRSYFVNMAQDIPDLGSLLKATVSNGGDTETTFRTIVEQATLTGDDWVLRRSNFLEHLLARFGETFNDHVLMHYASSGRLSEEETLEAKRRFLDELPMIAARRARGHDVSAADAVWNTSNVSGLTQRVSRLLGFASFERRNLSEVVHDFYEELDEDVASEIRFRVLDHRTRKIVLSSTKHYPSREAALAELRQAVKLGQDPDNYRIEPTEDGRFYFNVVDRTGDPVAMRKQYFATREAAGAERDRVVTLLVGRYSEEGLFVVENILLRPRDSTFGFLPVPCEADPQQPESWDPYSHRVHIILPGFRGRFAESAFRAALEDIVRRELPAHLLPTICFVGQKELGDFERAYRAWLESLASTAPGPSALELLIDALKELHTVYPKGTLHDCKEDGDEQNPIVLNQTHLGSLEPPTEPTPHS